MTIYSLDVLLFLYGTRVRSLQTSGHNIFVNQFLFYVYFCFKTPYICATDSLTLNSKSKALWLMAKQSIFNTSSLPEFRNTRQHFSIYLGGSLKMKSPTKSTKWEKCHMLNRPWTMCLFTPSRLQEEGGTFPCSASSRKAVTEWLQCFALPLTSSNHPEGSTLSMLEVTKKL